MSDAPKLRPGRRAAFAACALAIASAGSLALAEIAARATGHAPLVAEGGAEPDPGYEPDPVLGWVHRPGRHRVGGVDVTYLDDGRRRSGETTGGATRAIVIVGGSFSEGFGVPDSETFAWRLQERFPDRDVRNYGTGGYGTLQSLEMMDRQLERLAAGTPAVSAEWVVYGFIQNHIHRNVAVAGWRRMLAARSRGRAGEPVRVPWASLGADGGLSIHAPTAWPALALCRHSALATLAVDRLLALSTPERLEQSWPVTLRLIERMGAHAQRAGPRLAVASLLARPASARPVRETARRIGARFLDCSPAFPVADGLLDATGHPTAALHARYADCIARGLSAGPD